MRWLVKGHFCFLWQNVLLSSRIPVWKLNWSHRDYRLVITVYALMLKLHFIKQNKKCNIEFLFHHAEGAWWKWHSVYFSKNLKPFGETSEINSHLQKALLTVSNPDAVEAPRRRVRKRCPEACVSRCSQAKRKGEGLVEPSSSGWNNLCKPTEIAENWHSQATKAR